MIDPGLLKFLSGAGGSVAKSAGPRVFDYLIGSPQERAMHSMLQRAFLKVADEAVVDLDEDQAEQVRDVLEPWFNTPEVNKEILSFVQEHREPDMALLRGHYQKVAGDRDLPIDVEAWLPRILRETKRGLEAANENTESPLYGMFTSARVSRIHEAVRTETSETSRPDRGSLPRRPERLVGRDAELDRISERVISTGADACAVVAVGGLPGIGKTATLAEICNRDDVREEFQDRILWASLGFSPDLFATISGWSRSLGGPDLQEARTVEEATGRLRAFLSDQRVLVVADDVYRAEDAYMLQVLSRGVLLLSSRSPEVASELAKLPGSVHELEVLSPEDSARLVFQEADLLKEEDHPYVVELAGLLGGLPLFLKVAASMLESRKRSGLDLGSVVEKVQEGETFFARDVPADLRSFYGDRAKTLHALLWASLEDLSGEARYAFYALGAVAPMPSTFGLEAAEVVWASDEADALMEMLVNQGLVQSEGDGRFSIHPVLGAWATSLLDQSPDKAAIHARYASHYKSLLGSARERYFLGVEGRMQAMQRLEIDGQNILRGWSWIKENYESDEEATGLCVVYPDAAGKWFQLWLTQPQQIEWAEEAIGASRRLGDKVAEANNLRRLAYGQFNGGDIGGAIETSQRALDLVVNNSSAQEDSIVEASIRGLLGAFYREIGQATDAEYMLRRQIALSEGEGQSDQAALSEAGGRGNLVPLLRDHGRYDEAIEEGNRAYEIYEGVGDYYEAAGARSGLGTTYYEQGDYEASEREHLTYLFMALQMKNTKVEARAYSNLGNVNLAKDEPEEGLRYYEERLKLVREQQLSRVEFGSVIGCVARARAALGPDYDESFTFDNLFAQYKEALDLIRSGPVDPLLVGITLVEIAALHRDHGRATEGLEYAQEALTVFEELETPRNHADAWLESARCKREMDDYSGARGDATQAHSLYESIEHPEADKARTLLDELDNEAG